MPDTFSRDGVMFRKQDDTTFVAEIPDFSTAKKVLEHEPNRTFSQMCIDKVTAYFRLNPNFSTAANETLTFMTWNVHNFRSKEWKTHSKNSWSFRTYEGTKQYIISCNPSVFCLQEAIFTDRRASRKAGAYVNKQDFIAHFKDYELFFTRYFKEVDLVRVIGVRRCLRPTEQKNSVIINHKGTKILVYNVHLKLPDGDSEKTRKSLEKHIKKMKTVMETTSTQHAVMMGDINNTEGVVKSIMNKNGLLAENTKSITGLARKKILDMIWYTKNLIPFRLSMNEHDTRAHRMNFEKTSLLSDHIPVMQRLGVA